MQIRDSMPPYLNDLVDPVESRYTASSFPFSTQTREDPPPVLPLQEKIGVQVVLSLLVVGAFWLMFQSGANVPASWKASAREVMTRDFNFAGLSAWYRERFGQLPTVLPALTENKAVPAQGNAAAHSWKMPDTWKVAQPFDSTSTKMVVDVGPQGQIPAGEAGWVTFVGEKQDYGLTVVLRLTGNREVWYGNLAAVAVDKNDMVRQGEVLGVAEATATKTRLLYLGMKVNQQFINPLEVIALD